MKSLFKLMGLSLLLLTVGCGGNDDDGNTTTPMEPASLIGDWERTSGDFLGEPADFLLINADNTFYVLDEKDYGFRSQETGNYAAQDTQVTMDLGFGGNLLNYTVTDTTLELRDGSGSMSTFTRVSDAPSPNDWISTINIISQGDAPWNEEADIAFSGTHILLGNGYAADDIGIINVETFELDGIMTTNQSAFSVEVEKHDGVDAYLFQSNNGSSQFKAYLEGSDTASFTSLELGAWIYGLASVDTDHIWASSGNEQTLYLLNYADTGAQIIEQEYNIGQTIIGMDYQEGFLYVCYQGRIFKCDVSTTVQVVESYELEGYRAQGIAFDGTHFWVNASANEGGPHQIIKTSLTL